MASSIERIGVVQERGVEGNVSIIGSSSSESASSRVPLPSSSSVESSSPAAPRSPLLVLLLLDVAFGARCKTIWKVLAQQ